MDQTIDIDVWTIQQCAVLSTGTIANIDLTYSADTPTHVESLDGTAITSNTNPDTCPLLYVFAFNAGDCGNFLDEISDTLEHIQFENNLD